MVVFDVHSLGNAYGMKRKVAIVVPILFVLLVALLALIANFPRFKKVEKRGPTSESVAAILPGNLDVALAAIGVTFNDWANFDQSGRAGSYQNKFPRGSKWSNFFLFTKNDLQHPIFPSDEEIDRNRGVDSSAERYVQIPTGLRSRDLYLYEPSGEYYWESEYFYKGRPAKFRCSFLIHLEGAKGSGTNVEIFEYQPTIWVGEYLGLSAHAILPTTLHDIRTAQPTTADRNEVLGMIQQAAISLTGAPRSESR